MTSESPSTSITSTPSSTASGDSEDTSTTTTIASVDSRIREITGIPVVDLLTPEAGGGARPELAWEPVDQAFFYNVVVLDPSGGGYWGWEGTATAVHVGGEPVITAGLSGPSVIDGMSWQVSAYDSDQNLIALSHQQPIAP